MGDALMGQGTACCNEQLGLSAQCLGPSISGFGFRLSDFGKRVSGFQVSGFSFRESATGSCIGNSGLKPMNSGSSHISATAGPLHGLGCRGSE